MHRNHEPALSARSRATPLSQALRADPDLCQCWAMDGWPVVGCLSIARHRVRRALRRCCLCRGHFTRPNLVAAAWRECDTCHDATSAIEPGLLSTPLLCPISASLHALLGGVCLRLCADLCSDGGARRRNRRCHHIWHRLDLARASLGLGWTALRPAPTSACSYAAAGTLSILARYRSARPG